MHFTFPSIALMTGGGLLLLVAVFNLLSISGWKALLRGALVFGAGVSGSVMIVGGLDLASYENLLAEENVATLHFEMEKPQLYLATIQYKGQQSGRPVETFHLNGDEWQLDVRLVKWNRRLAAYGMQPMYHLDRISGRYRDVQQAISAARSVHSLYEPVAGLDFWEIAQEYSWVAKLVDARYGSATYLPMADGAVYEVSIGVNGLLARPANAPAAHAVKHW